MRRLVTGPSEGVKKWNHLVKTLRRATTQKVGARVEDRVWPRIGEPRVNWDAFICKRETYEID